MVSEQTISVCFMGLDMNRSLPRIYIGTTLDHRMPSLLRKILCVLKFTWFQCRIDLEQQEPSFKRKNRGSKKTFRGLFDLPGSLQQ